MKYFIKSGSYFSENSTVFDSNNRPVFLIKVRSISFKTGISVFNLLKEELSRTEKRFVFPFFPEYQVFTKKIKIGKLKKILFNPVSPDYKLVLNNQEYFVRFVQKYGYKVFKNEKEVALLDTKGDGNMSFIDYLKHIFKREHSIIIGENEDQAIIIAVLMTVFHRNCLRIGPSII